MKTSIFFIFISFLATPLLFSQENQVYQGNINQKSLADAYLLGISYGPMLPDNLFRELSLPKKEYIEAQYRITYTRQEIYPFLNVELIAQTEESHYVLVDSFSLPLEKALNYDRGNIQIIKWESHNKFVIKCTGIEPDFLVEISIFPNGKFLIKRI